MREKVTRFESRIDLARMLREVVAGRRAVRATHV
jgi:hypothetical protein